MKPSVRFILAMACVFGCVHCAVSVDVPDAGSTGDGGTVLNPDPPQVPLTPTCEQVRATCGSDPAAVVRGHATGLDEFEGGEVAFAVRYLLSEGQGLSVPRGVAVGRTTVRDGAFETCVCVPHSTNAYPEIVTVVFRPQATARTANDVARATFSLRYATLGGEDVSTYLTEAPTRVHAEAAVAALDPRVVRTTLRASGSGVEGNALWAGLAADARTVVAEVAQGAVGHARAELQWVRPGGAMPGERIVVVFDRDNDQRCTQADIGATVPFTGQSAIDLPGTGWIEGPAVNALCATLAVGDTRWQ